MQVGETLQIEHVNLIDEEHARHELSCSLLNEIVDNVVDLGTETISTVPF